MRVINLYIILVGILFFTNNVFGQTNGKLFIIGGGDRSHGLVTDMVTTAGLKPTDYIVILPMATSVPEESIAAISKQIRSVANHNIVSFNFDKDQAYNHLTWIDSVKNAKLIYITGGDQNKFMEIVSGSKLYDAMHMAYANGATISGTSAGAAIMSEVMITGEIKGKQSGGTLNEIVNDIVATSKGMGFLKNVIIDQHFIMRSRYNRLLSIVADHPQLVGIGIDEATAIVVEGNNYRVVGDSQVLVVKLPKIIKSNDKKKLSFRDASLSLYTAGQNFKLKK